jgi:hypothetical protein
MHSHEIPHRTIAALSLIGFVAACAPSASTPEPTSDTIATAVAQAEAVAATLTARAPVPSPTFQPTDTPAASPTVQPTDALAASPTPTLGDAIQSFSIADIMQRIDSECAPASRDWSSDTAWQELGPFVPEAALVRWSISQYDHYSGTETCWYATGYLSENDIFFLFLNLEGAPTLLEYTQSLIPLQG